MSQPKVTFKYYLRFKKFGTAVWISHLDMVRTFQRIFMRAGVNIVFSEGFNPHPKISFALPLSVFYESECEIMLFAVSEDITAEELFNRFKPVMPEGLEIIEVCEGKPEVKKLSYCLYNVYCSLPAEKELEAFLALPSMVVPKKTKSGIKDTDIRGDITDIKLEDGYMTMLLSAGSNANLKPDVVIKAMNKYIENFDAGDCEYLRKAIYTDDMVEI